MIYFLKPAVSNLNDSIWEDFYNGAFNILKKFRPQNILEIDSLDSFYFKTDASSKDLLIFFNPRTDNYQLNKVLKEAIEKQMNIFPIAINESIRTPPKIADKYQSFDIITEKKLRGLDDQYIKIIGECFGRDVIVSYYPALFDDKINIFLSHKRTDFESDANLFKTYLHENKEKVFIDLHEVKQGEDAQEKIEAKLNERTDVLIFIQTKDTYISDYQLVELKKAFELSIPVLWVTLGLSDNEFKKLPLHPTGIPHFKLEELNSVNVNKIMNYAFDLIRLKKQRLLDDIIYKFKFFKSKNISYEEICDQDNIYQIIRESKDELFPDTKKRDYRFFKCVCRNYKPEDLENLKNYLTANSTNNCILSLKNESRELEPNIFLKNYESFLKDHNEIKLIGGVIISGSFPDSLDTKYQQNIIDALYTIVKGILEKGGKIIFGSHPTFQGIILEIGKLFNSKLEKKIKLYVSKQFEGGYDLKYFQEYSEVFEIEKDPSGDISSSLTKMRKAMISDEDAQALICIGGKEKGTSLTKITGLDEEIQLAKQNHLKVFVLGSTGGRSKQLIEEGFENPLKNKENNIEISYGNNFKSILNLILNDLGEKI